MAAETPLAGAVTGPGVDVLVTTLVCVTAGDAFVTVVVLDVAVVKLVVVVVVLDAAVVFVLDAVVVVVVVGQSVIPIGADVEALPSSPSVVCARVHAEDADTSPSTCGSATESVVPPPAKRTDPEKVVGPPPVAGVNVSVYDAALYPPLPVAPGPAGVNLLQVMVAQPHATDRLAVCA